MPMLETPKSKETSTPQRRSEVQPRNVWRYPVSKEASLAWFLGISVMLFLTATFVAVLLPPKDKLPPMIEVDLGIDGVENEPPPLGEPEAGAGEPQPEPEKPPEMQEPEPEPVPEEPVVETPVSEPAPTFIVPEEEKPKPPEPKPLTKPKPKPAKPVANVSQTQAAPAAGSGIAGANSGVRGSPGGVPGGRGGGRGDFISTPHPQYDTTARERRYEGRGMFLITYQSGRIVSVSTIQSTGVAYLDAKTIAHVRSRFRVKSGVSGSARLPIVWRLK